MKISEIITEDTNAMMGKLKELYQRLTDIPGFSKRFKEISANKPLINSVIQDLQIEAKRAPLSKEKIVDVIKSKIPESSDITESLGGTKWSILWSIAGVVLITFGTMGAGLVVAFGITCIMAMLGHFKTATDLDKIINPPPTSLEHKMFEAELQTATQEITKLTTQALMRDKGGPNQNKIIAIQRHFIELMVHEVKIKPGPYDKRLATARQIVNACRAKFDETFGEQVEEDATPESIAQINKLTRR